MVMKSADVCMSASGQERDCLVVAAFLMGAIVGAFVVAASAAGACVVRASVTVTTAAEALGNAHSTQHACTMVQVSLHVNGSSVAEMLQLCLALKQMGSAVSESCQARGALCVMMKSAGACGCACGWHFQWPVVARGLQCLGGARCAVVQYVGAGGWGCDWHSQWAVFGL